MHLLSIFLIFQRDFISKIFLNACEIAVSSERKIFTESKHFMMFYIFIYTLRNINNTFGQLLQFFNNVIDVFTTGYLKT